MSKHSLTTEVFGDPPTFGHYWVYYIIENRQDLAKLERQANPVVLMFWANNEPCEVMLTPFRYMAIAKRKQAIFCRLDIGKFRDITQQYGVEVTPTIVLKKNGSEIARVVGPKVDELNTKIRGNI